MGGLIDEHSNEVGASRKDGSLEDTQEEASSEEATQTADEPLHDGNETEAKHHDRH